jgi:hypothetical protein
MAKSAWKTFAATVFVAAACGAHTASAVARAEGWAWPVTGPVITPFLNDNARPYAGGMHRGIDIAAPAGTKVGAARAGTVTYAGALGSSGLTVAIATSDGAHLTSYLHLSRISVHRGDGVEAGGEIGAVGTTGERSASEPHLHFGVRRAGEPDFYVDPLSLLPALSPTNRAVPPASVPARDQVRAGPAPAPIPSRLTVPLGRSLRLPGKAPAVLGMPRRAPKPKPLGASAPLGSRVPARAEESPPLRVAAGSQDARRSPLARDSRLRGTAPVADRVPRASTASGLGATEPVSRRSRYGVLEGERRREASAPPRAAADPAGAGLGRLLTIAGLALIAVTFAGARLLRFHRQLPARLVALARLGRQRPQPGACPARPAAARLVGVSQMS